MSLIFTEFGQFLIFIAFFIVFGVWVVSRISDRAARKKVFLLEAELQLCRDRLDRQVGNSD